MSHYAFCYKYNIHKNKHIITIHFSIETSDIKKYNANK